jgi:hypothetical protein
MQKEPVFLIKVGPKKGLGSIKGRTLIINGGNLRGHVSKILKQVQDDEGAG